MFVASHLRDPPARPRGPRSDAAGPGRALPGCRSGSGPPHRTAGISTTRACRARSSLEVGLFDLGWVLMIVAMMLPSSVPLVVTFAALVGRRAPTGQAGRPPAGRLSRRVGGLRPRRVGPRPRHPRRGRGRALAGGASRADPGVDAPRRGAVAVQPAPGPLSRRVPQPARLRDEPLARHVRAT